MKTELDIIADIARRFDALGIPYMLTGSIAMNYYAEPRMTRDIDVVIALRSEDIESLISEFSPDYYIEREAVRESIQHESVFNLLHMESIIKIDCIIRKSTEYRRVEFERRKRIAIESISTYIVSKEDLILSKLYWARDSRSEMQIRDVANLMQTGYDEQYVRFWANKLGIGDLLEEVRHG